MALTSDRDLHLQALMREELELPPAVDAAAMDVSVEGGAVTLSGEHGNHAERLAIADNVPATMIAEIHDRGVVLMGEADGDYRRRAAERIVHYPRMVRATCNLVRLRWRLSSEGAEGTIGRAITVTVDGTCVRVTGTVTSWADRRRAENVAWSSPDVSEVENHLTVAE